MFSAIQTDEMQSERSNEEPDVCCVGEELRLTYSEWCEVVYCVDAAETLLQLGHPSTSQIEEFNVSLEGFWDETEFTESDDKTLVTSNVGEPKTMKSCKTEDTAMPKTTLDG